MDKSFEIKKWKGSVLSRSVIYVFTSCVCVCLCCPDAPGAEKGGGPGAERGGGLAAGPEQGGPDLVAPARAGERKSEVFIYSNMSRQTVVATPESTECNLWTNSSFWCSFHILEAHVDTLGGRLKFVKTALHRVRYCMYSNQMKVVYAFLWNSNTLLVNILTYNFNGKVFRQKPCRFSQVQD